MGGIRKGYTDRMQRFQKAVEEIMEQKDIRMLSQKLAGKKVIIWGAGNCGHHVYEALCEQKATVSFFGDNALAGKTDAQTGLLVIGMDEAATDRENTYVLLSVVEREPYQKIYGQLLEAGFQDDQIVCMSSYIERLPVSFFSNNVENYRKVYETLADDFSREVYIERMKRVYLLNDMTAIVSPPEELYFDARNVLTGEEVFVDCGGYVGDTALQFIEKCGGKYRKILIFEPESCNKKAIEDNLQGEKYELFPYGVWSEDTVLSFDARGTEGSCIVKEETGNRIQVVSLDHCVYAQKPTFIKMDIEVAELEALKGSERIIEEYKPKLAICLYHKPEDLFEIPLFVKQLREDYDLYIRQYRADRYETVLYAV